MDTSDNFDNRGLLDLPISSSSLGLITSLEATTSPQQNPPQTSPTPDGNTNTTNPNTSPNTSTPTSNSYSPDPNSTNPSNPSPTSGSSSSQSSGKPQDGSAHPSSGSSGDSGSSGKVIFTTISGMGTQVTQVPHSGSGVPDTGSGSTGGSGDGSVGGSGTNSPGGGGSGPAIIGVIVIGVALALVLLAFFIRKRAMKWGVAQRTRCLPSGKKGPRGTFRSSFGDLRASSFGYPSDHSCDNPSSNRRSDPLPSLTSTGSPTPQMTQDVRYDDNGERIPTDQFRPTSPISVRPFTPSESWSFPKPPNPRIKSLAHSSEIKGSQSPHPFSYPAPRLFTTNLPLVLSNGSPESVRGLEGPIPLDYLRPNGNRDALFVDTGLQHTRKVNVWRW